MSLTEDSCLSEYNKQETNIYYFTLILAKQCTEVEIVACH